MTCHSAETNRGADGNLLQTLTANAPEGEAYSRLEYVALNNNLLESLDVSACRRLRYLDLDQNRLQSLEGIESLINLDELSLRKQDLAGAHTAFAASVLQQTLHCRSLYLSSNALSSLDISNNFHSIQHLELASCGIADIPSDFGLRFPNLQTINLNFNAIKDPRPLLNINNLKNLYLAGNRLARLRKSVATLAKFSKLRILDIRENPFTHGFYAPLANKSTETQIISIRGPAAHHRRNPSLSATQKIRQEAHLLAEADVTVDAEHVARLDEDTKLRRRVYELLLANSCKTLSSLDGLGFGRERIMVKDGVFERLVKLGIVKRSEAGNEGIEKVLEATKELEGLV